jgi:hypothetical protein
MEVTCSSNTSVDFQWRTWHYIPKDITVQGGDSTHNNRCLPNFPVLNACSISKEKEVQSIPKYLNNIMFQRNEEHTFLWQHSHIIKAFKITSLSDKTISKSTIWISHDTGEVHHFNFGLCTTFIDLQLALVVRMCGALQYVKEDNKLCY